MRNVRNNEVTGIGTEAKVSPLLRDTGGHFDASIQPCALRACTQVTQVFESAQVMRGTWQAEHTTSRCTKCKETKHTH